MRIDLYLMMKKELYIFILGILKKYQNIIFIKKKLKTLE